MGAFRTFFGASGPDGLPPTVDGGLVVAHASLGCAFVLNARGEVTHFVRSPRGPDRHQRRLSPGHAQLVLTDSATGSVLEATLPAGGRPVLAPSA